MAINISDNNPRVNYTATSGQTVFTVPFEFFASTDLTVYVDGSVLAVSDYTVTGGSGSTGSITTDSGQTTGAKIAIVRDVPLERTTDLTSTYSASSLNDQLDRIVTQIADLDDRVSRSISLNDYEVGVSLDLPATATRLGKTIQFNSSTGALEIGPSGNELTSIASIASEITALDGIKTNITTVASAITNVNSVGSNISSVTSVASSISNVNTVNTNIANVNSVAGSISDLNDVADSLDQVELVGGSISNVDIVGPAIANVNTVAGDISNINTVAGISANITTVAGITADISTVNSNSTNINLVATNIDDVNDVANVITKVTTVADNIANVNTVAPSVGYLSTVANNIANINTLAPISADITTVAGVASSIANAAANAAAAEAAKVAAELAADNFDDTYLGAKSSDPTVDNDGDALNAGDLYFSTTDNNLKVYSGSAWQDAAIDSSSFVQTTGDSMTGNLTIAGNLTLGLINQANRTFFMGSNYNSYFDIGTSLNSTLITSGSAISDTTLKFRVADGGTETTILDISKTGVDVTGTVTMDGGSTSADFTFGDNDKAIFGAGSDLQIYHDGNHSRIVETGGGDIIIQGDEFSLMNVAGTEYMIFADNDSFVKLYYDGGAKLATTSTGVDITGTLTSDGLTVDGTTTTDGLNLDAISEAIADTAVDIFVYDTRKDSDGGAWRKRTQHTSWYNETLNTATRGSRKEFPAVAVILATSSGITIYDGDDPDLPMWISYTNEGNISSISALNGRLFYGNTNGGSTIDYLMDKYLLGYRSSGSRYYLRLNASSGSISFSNIAPSSGDLIGTIVNNTVNDVAMTVLPNAPIDAATGLPVPTIAVATDGGISVIRDDGTVVDVTESSGPDSTHAIEFTDDNKIVFMWSDTSGIDNYPHIGVMPIPSSDVSQAYYYSSSFIEEDYSYSSTFTNANDGIVVVPNANYQRDFKALSPNKSIGYDSGLSHIYSNPSDSRKSMVVFTTSDYNTGWMNGDIKLATLSDTDDTDVTGSELVTNGTFDSDSDWNKVLNGWTISGGTANHSGSEGYLEQTGVFEVGKTYVLTFTNTGTVILPSGTGISSSNAIYGSSGTYHVTGVAVSTKLSFYSNTTTTLDNVSVRLAEEDRSVNGNGLQVFGTVTKDPVATGADLVAYSGFSGSNYLMQPYNSDLDFGTGDFCVMGWYNTSNSTTTEVLLSRVDSGNVAAISCMITSSETLILQVREGSTSSTVTTTDTAATGVWNSFAFVRRNSGTVQEVYINGKLSISGTVTARNMSSSTGKVYLGYTPELASNAKGSMALWRISATAPSPEQIKKIYEDEKVLFQENAQATLYGSSDAVTALAYDDNTELLHVGTSAGRSVFQGLRRVDNTTTAVTAAISASNNLVADE